MKKIILILLVLTLAGCDLLETRDPEKPNAARSDFRTPTQPSILFSNLTNSLKEKVVENYLQCFVDESFLDDNFVFIPSASSGIRLDLFKEWDLESERQYFNNIKSLIPAESQILLKLENEINFTRADSAVYQFDYSLTVPIINGDQNLFKGSVVFTIKSDRRSNWVITRWEDLKNEEFPSWSDLKGTYY
ncbi:MAG: hypothetical protein CVV23_09500 [Ignavibacteriae bacterium HGW-Ignavibacteriae-2]|jgi:hypothetical protein|nr:MAG: hypothetical protein CVV23_09500 [Ignavibacteriae bacterium HGW-Ignavibacteriae-2]